jgi:hypothetical protein
MGRYTQRKRFDHRQDAERSAVAFHEPQFRIPGIEVRTSVVEEDGGFWLHLTQEGAIITEETTTEAGAILPEYERVA